MTFDALFHDYVDFVWRSLRHFGVAEADLEDQTQEVFLVAHRHFANVSVEHPRAWLYAIARRAASGYRRRSYRRHERAVENVPESSHSRDPAAGVELDRLASVLDTLDEDKRTVFLLHDVEEMPMREVAEAVGCPLSTAYARLHAARRELAKAIQEAP
ncbi:MAG: RNA polymerase sigma factor [Labilithrix sp.]|nr:RNA polymerase sigma factor [Labilithrix sp.]MBX3216093.1 RNA polymerase sigma factor [Labilithrix sp.]